MLRQSIPKQAQVALLLAAVRRRQRQAVETRVAHLGLSSQQFWVLDAIRQSSGCSLSDLMTTVAMDQPTASRVLASLCERELVRAENDPDDRRRRCLDLTNRGARLAEQCAAIAVQIRRAVVTGFSQKELTSLHSFLNRFVENLDHLDTVDPPELRGSERKGLPKSRARSNDSYARAATFSKRLPS